MRQFTSLLTAIRRRKLVRVEQLLDDEDESDKENAPDFDPTTTSMWMDSINKIEQNRVIV